MNERRQRRLFVITLDKMCHTFAAETPAGQKTPRIRSTLVLLSGREEPWPTEGEYRTSPEDAPFSGVSFRIEAVSTSARCGA